MFDTGLSDFNFARSSPGNRYSGYDRINDANQLTAAVTTRLLDGTTGVGRFKAMLGQRYYFKPQRVADSGKRHAGRRSRISSPPSSSLIAFRRLCRRRLGIQLTATTSATFLGRGRGSARKYGKGAIGQLPLRVTR